MRWRNIVCSVLAVAGCSGTGTGDSATPPEMGDALKVTYIRFNLDPRTKRYVPEYRIMISRSWRTRFGDDPREPFAKLFRRGSRAPFFGEVPDEKMRGLLREMERKGLAKLVSTAPEEIDLVGLTQVEKSQTDPPYTRIVTVGGEKGHKSYLFRNNNASEEALKAFVQCEREVIKMGVQYTAQVSAEAVPLIPKD